MKKSWLIRLSEVLVLVSLVVLPWFVVKQVRLVQMRQRAKVILGMDPFSDEMAARHVWISEHVLTPNKYGDVPVHIMYRARGSQTWILSGTGAIMGRPSPPTPSNLLSAAHVFAGKPGYYGARRIGPEEFTGQVPIVPIIECRYGDLADDRAMCILGKIGEDFPLISVPSLPAGTFKRFEYDRPYTVTMWLPTILRFTTYPEKEIQPLLSIWVNPGKRLVYCDWEMALGESGTVGIIDGDDQVYFILCRMGTIPRDFYDKFTPEFRKRLNWSENKYYSIGTLVRYGPESKPQ